MIGLGRQDRRDLIRWLICGVVVLFVHAGIAFNVSDLAIGVGDLMLIAAALLYAARHRGDLRRPA